MLRVLQVNNLQAVAWREYLLHGANGGMGLQPAQQALLSGVVCALPWNLKLPVAFASDAGPRCCGLRRLPWMALGMLLQGGGWLLLGLLGSTATLPLIAGQQFAVTLGQMITGVMCDTMVVESARLESGERIGTLQVATQLAFAPDSPLRSPSPSSLAPTLFILPGRWPRSSPSLPAASRARPSRGCSLSTRT